MQRIELGTFLKWAFGEELAHVAVAAEGGGWAQIASFAALGTVIDKQGHGVPELSNVHPDALAANEAVMLLSAEVFSLPEGWNPVPDIDDPHGVVAECVAEVMARRAMRDGLSLSSNLMNMVVSLAVMGREPEWRAEQPAFRMVERGGKPAWFVRAEQKDAFGRVYAYDADGYDARGGRPKPGAFRKYQLSEPFGGAVQGRIDHYLWAKALSVVHARLQKGLIAHQILPWRFDPEPWRVETNLEGRAQVLEKVAR